MGRWGVRGGAKPPRAEGSTGGDKVRSTSSPQVLMSGRRTAELQKSDFSWLCTSPEITFKPEQHSKKTVRLTRRLLIWKIPLGSWQPRLLVWRCGAHASSLDGAAGLKNMPLAYVLEVGVPELHFAGRPPYNYRKIFVARGEGWARREGRLHAGSRHWPFRCFSDSSDSRRSSGARKRAPFAYVLHVSPQAFRSVAGRAAQNHRK